MNDAAVGTKRTIPVLQGEFKISSNPNEVMVTVLGSCVATCLWDEKARIGGMNHFLLAGADEPKDGNLKYGINSMELLINGMLRAGATRENLKAKLFGGAKMISSSRQIGQENAEFAKWFLENENIPCVGMCLGGEQGRKIRFQPTEGSAQRLFLGDPLKIDSATLKHKKPSRTAAPNIRKPDQVELF